MRKTIDIINQKFGKLTAIEFIGSKNNGRRAEWKCMCECGNYTVATGADLRQGKRTTCGCFRKGKNHYRWQGYGEISGTVICMIKTGAKDRNIEFDLTAEYLWKLFLKQKRKCALTGMDIFFSDSADSRFIFDVMTASLDRIDSNKGYIEGNVQWVHKYINIMKWDFTQDEFIDMCRLVINHRDRNE